MPRDCKENERKARTAAGSIGRSSTHASIEERRRNIWYVRLVLSARAAPERRPSDGRAPPSTADTRTRLSFVCVPELHGASGLFLAPLGVACICTSSMCRASRLMRFFRLFDFLRVLIVSRIYFILSKKKKILTSLIDLIIENIYNDIYRRLCFSSTESERYKSLIFRSFFRSVLSRDFSRPYPEFY